MKQSSLMCCDVCGCILPKEVAKEKGWGVLFGKPSCSKKCANVLYEPKVVEQHWKER